MCFLISSYHREAERERIHYDLCVSTAAAAGQTLEKSKAYWYSSNLTFCIFPVFLFSIPLVKRRPIWPFFRGPLIAKLATLETIAAIYAVRLQRVPPGPFPSTTVVRFATVF